MSDSSIRRRDFVAGATAVAAGMALTSESLALDNKSLHNMTQVDFAQLIGQSFSVDGLSEQGTRQRGSLVLKEVVEHDTGKNDRPSHLRSEPFSLYFESQDLALTNDTHFVFGGGLQPQGVFLHEMLDQRRPGRRQYEAVFN